MPIYAHKTYDFARKRSIAFARNAAPGMICFCIGPGGAGKTSMARMLGREAYGLKEVWPERTQPYVYTEANLSDRAYFSPKTYIKGCLSALSDPFRATPAEVESWEAAPVIKRALQSGSIRTARVATSEPEMRDAFVNLARTLRVRTLIVDEANLLVLTQKGRVATDYLESIRGLGDSIGCNIMLFGTVRMIELSGHSAQLNRRTTYVHVGRMNAGDVAGRLEFKCFLSAMENDHRLQKGLLTSHAEAIWAWSYGIAGVVVKLLEDAEQLRQAEEAATVTWEHIRHEKPGNDVIAQMREEADLIQAYLDGGESALTQVAAKAHVKPNRTAQCPRKKAGVAL